MEGNDEKHVVKKLLKRHNLRPSFDIKPKGGFNGVRESIYNEVNASGRRILGILVDANANPDRRWQSIADSLTKAGCDVPANQPEAGSVFAGPRGIQVGVWLMPNNVRSGQLEDFIAELVPQSDPIWPRACCYIDGIPDRERLFRPQKITGAYVHAWLATREKPRPMGQAITTGDLNHNAAVATAFIEWLKNLFVLKPT